MANLNSAIETILEIRDRVPAERTALISLTGIDASGKGYLTAKMADALQLRHMRVANINIDGWVNLPHIRFGQVNPAEHFYLYAIRFEEMFRSLVFPLRARRSLRIEMDYAEETASEYRKRTCEYVDIDAILLEGIYLLKIPFQAYYDFSFWIDCTFETALERALGRGQEGLSAEATIQAYRTIYFPAQEIHFVRDNPRRAASAVIENDPRLLSCANWMTAKPTPKRRL